MYIECFHKNSYQIVCLRINVFEKKLEDVEYEIRGWEEKNRRNVERVSRC